VKSVNSQWSIVNSEVNDMHEKLQQEIF